jgi:hypothetical protein
MNPQELIATLKSQHRELQADLAIESEKGEDIAPRLSKFKVDLLGHLKLENGIFYPDYLDRQTKRGGEVENIKQFIKQMDDIGKTVMAFLGRYAFPEVINQNLPTFRMELASIVSTLNLRIEAEEEGVYDLYLAIAI